MKRVFILLTTFLLSFVFFAYHHAYAAEFIRGDTVILEKSSSPLKNAYVFGGTVNIKQQIEQDLVTAGGNVTVDGDVTGSAMAAGGNIVVNSKVGNSVRAAGGNTTINNAVAGDVVFAGGSLTIGNNAAISGDVVFSGGQLTIEGPVGGKVIANGGQVVINNIVGKSVEGEMGSLTLGSKAVIKGNLSYSSDQRAQIHDGAKILGEHNFKKSEKKKAAARGLATLFAAGTVYKLLIDIVFSLFFIFFLRKFTVESVRLINNQPLKNGLLGFAALILTPILALILLIVFLLGIPLFLLYIISIFIAVGLTKVFVGWKVVSWWEAQNKRKYELDWKAAVIGSIGVLLLLFVPFIGWLIGFILFLLAFGSVISQLFSFVTQQRSIEKKVRGGR